MKRRFLGALGTVATLALTLPAFADGDADAQRVKAAADEFDAGRRAFKAKDYAVAAEHFENANRDAPAPEALRSAIRARNEAKQDARAATLAALALARYPDDKATNALAKKILAPVAKTLHQLTVHCATACTLVVDRKVSPWGEAKDAVLWLDPGSHTIVAGWGESRDRSSTVTATAGGSSEISLTAPEPVATAPTTALTASAAPTSSSAPTEAPAEHKSGLPPVVFFAAAGVTVVLAGISTWSAIAMRSNPGKDKVRADCVNQGESCPTFQDALSAQHRTDILFIATGVAAVGTGVIGTLFTNWSGDPKPASDAPASPAAIRAVPTLSVGQGVFVGANGTF